MRYAAIVAAVAHLAAATPADGPASRKDAALLKQKVATITAHAESQSSLPRRTTVTENEVNAYLVYEAGNQIPVGVVEPSLTILGTGRLSARAVVDLDAVRKARTSSSLLDPLNFLTGRLPVTATGVLKTGNGMGKFELENSSVAGIRVPKILLQEIVSYYSRTADKPEGIGLDDPFELPARIREIQVERGQAIIVQ